MRTLYINTFHALNGLITNAHCQCEYMPQVNLRNPTAMVDTRLMFPSTSHPLLDLPPSV